MGTFTNLNYWALILGGSSGIGLQAARKLASQGMHLCLVYRGRRAEARAAESAFEEMRQSGQQVLGLNLDACKASSIADTLTALQQAMGETGKIRLLLHSIAKGNLKPLVNNPQEPELPIESAELKSIYQELQGTATVLKTHQTLHSDDFQLTIYNMALSLLDWVQALHQQGLFAEDARVLGLTSEGNQKTLANYAAVSAAKLALEGLIRAIALEYAPFGIRANVLQPGITNTPSLRLIPGSEAIKANAIYRNPFNRLTTPEDVANVIYLMCKEESAWINGAIIPVDGGERMR